MKHTWVFSIYFLGILNSCFRFSEVDRESIPLIAQKKKKNGSYFQCITLTKFTPAEIPCILVRVGDKTVSSELDLGFRGHFCFSEDFIETIPDKVYLGTKKTVGFKGKTYEKKMYRIPFIQIGETMFSDPLILEEQDQFVMDATMIKKDHEPSPSESGRVGWEIFQLVNLFLDLRNFKIAVCDSLSTLEDKEYSVGSFVQAPLLLDRGLVEFEIETQDGILRCLLDTGSTWNLINQKVPLDQESIEDPIWNPKNHLEFPEFSFGGKKFGAVRFRPLPIELPFHIDAVLGMEFLEEHLVFLDFKNKQIYIAQAR